MGGILKRGVLRDAHLAALDQFNLPSQSWGGITNRIRSNFGIVQHYGQFSCGTLHLVHQSKKL
jgi:hypothetical protein